MTPYQQIKEVMNAAGGVSYWNEGRFEKFVVNGVHMILEQTNDEGSYELWHMTSLRGRVADDIQFIKNL